MRQILLWLSLEGLLEAWPYLAVGALLYALGRFLDRRAVGEGRRFEIFGGVVGGLVAAVGLAAFTVPHSPALPIYGYGAMLTVACVACLWLAGRLARREGIPPELVQDLAIWLFIFGLLGARITFVIQYRHLFRNFWQMIALWDGGLVFYGSFIGGVVGYVLCYLVVLRRRGISPWKLADVVAPCLAVGLAIGRLGCLLNGCCYGNVACPDCPAVCFAFSSMPRQAMTEAGYQTDAGFTLSPTKARTVEMVEPHSPAAQAGLKTGDQIITIEGKTIDWNGDITLALRGDWPRGKNDVQLTVRHADGNEETLPAFAPRTIGLHPTQLYETISMFLLLLVLLAYYPLKVRDGSVLVLWMLAYSVHRFLNEMLRTDTQPVFLDMTLSENISILVFTAGVILGLYLWLARKPPAPVLA